MCTTSYTGSIGINSLVGEDMSADIRMDTEAADMGVDVGTEAAEEGIELYILFMIIVFLCVLFKSAAFA